MKDPKVSPPKSGDPSLRPAGSKKKRRRGEPSSPPAKPAEAVLSRPSKLFVAVLGLAIGLATLAVYWQTFRHGFTGFDDNHYVYENPRVKAGLSAANVAWAFTTFFMANWHPLTWLSYMLDSQLFGLNAGVSHLVNVAFHVGSAVLLLLALVRMTGKPWRSALVAGIFALHPLHVESVAWVAERKDVLSAFFGMLTLLLYVRYTEESTAQRYLAMAGAFALGLLAKPMLVTFPFVLLLLDFWPLRRLGWPPAWLALKRLLWEKAPLLAMAAASSVLTTLAQRGSGAVLPLALRPMSARFANAAIAYVAYLGKAFWPANLAVFYPYDVPSPESVLGAVVILGAATAATLLWVRRRPHLLVGWLWYVGMLVPVIGIVQVGEQAMADRYTYLPLIGLSLAVVWGAAEFLERLRLPRFAGAILAGVALLFFAIGAYRQAGYWKDARTLAEHTLAVTERNSVVHYSLALVLAGEQKDEEAVTHFQEALAISPYYAEAHADLAAVLARHGRLDEALTHAAEAVRLKPYYAEGQGQLCAVLGQLGRFDEAMTHCTETLRLKPDYAEGQGNLCAVLSRVGRTDEAIAHCTEAARLNPDYAQAQNNLCVLLTQQGRISEALPPCAEALRLSPENLEARYSLGRVLAARGKTAEAVAELSRVLAANPSHAAARSLLQQLQGTGGR